MTCTKREALPVLVVDDNPGDQRLAAIAMGEAWPFDHELELHFATDGREALAQIQRKQFALIVLDWKLPIFGEGAVLRHLRQNGLRIPVVIISSADREDIRADLDDLGGAYLSKDKMNPETFRHAIARSLALLGQPAPPTVPTAPAP